LRNTQMSRCGAQRSSCSLWVATPAMLKQRSNADLCCGRTLALTFRSH